MCWLDGSEGTEGSPPSFFVLLGGGRCKVAALGHSEGLVSARCCRSFACLKPAARGCFERPRRAGLACPAPCHSGPEGHRPSLLYLRGTRQPDPPLCHLLRVLRFSSQDMRQQCWRPRALGDRRSDIKKEAASARTATGDSHGAGRPTALAASPDTSNDCTLNRPTTATSRNQSGNPRHALATRHARRQCQPISRSRLCAN